MKQLLFQGAESKIYTEEYLGKRMLVKERFEKKYRNTELDTNLTKERIKAECRNLVRSKEAGVKTPTLYFVDLNKRLIYMEYFQESITVKECIQNLQRNVSDNNHILDLATVIGEAIAKLHASNIVHGDLTTSNLLLINKTETSLGELVMIDFGLSSSDASAEDKGVDLYVLQRALSSTHANTDDLFDNILKSYCKTYGKNGNSVISKYEEVAARGRKRTMVG